MSQPVRRRDIAALWQLYDTVAAQQQATSQSIRLATGATSGLLAIGASEDVTVPWDDPIPTDVFRTRVVLLSLLNRATAAVTAATRTGCTVRVTAGVLLPAGAQFLVLATA